MGDACAHNLYITQNLYTSNSYICKNIIMNYKNKQMCPDGMTAIQHLAQIRKMKKREQKVSMIAEGMDRAERMEETREMLKSYIS